jgi:adenylylsulfate kinase
MIVWFTGLPASGKTTLAYRARERLTHASVVLDSDEIRAALGTLEYRARDRDAFYEALGKLALLLERQDLVVLVAATAPRRAHREAVRARASRFVEVWVRARAGDAPDLPGVGAVYEPPLAADVIANGGHDEAAVAAIVARITS